MGPHGLQYLSAPTPSMSTLERLSAALAGRYRLQREIGRGGMATVYLADDLRHGRHVAVKVLNAELAAGTGVDRFLREVRFTAALQHPHILTLIDSGEADGVVYYVMPFVEGESLRERLRRTAAPLPVDDALGILREILDALAHAHRQGIVHRDVKPENVMLTGRHALVLDFGVARAVQSARRAVADAEAPADSTSSDALTSVGVSLGTPAYMAPEQAAGDPNVDARADLYSAGLVAWEMLTGRPAFTGRPHEILARQVSTNPEPLAKAAPGVSAPVVRLVEGLIAKDPAARPASADAAIEMLDAARLPVATGPMAALERRIGRVGARAVVGGAVAAVAVLGWRAATGGGEARWARETAPLEIQRLVDSSRVDSAFAVLERALAAAPADPALLKIAPRVSRLVTFVSEPPGARVRWSVAPDSSAWHDLGVTPFTSRIPAMFLHVAFEQPGRRAEIVAERPAGLRGFARDTVRIALDDVAGKDTGMVLVPGGRAEVAMPGLSRLPVLPLAPFRIGRLEVTNAEFREFVQAGGYEKAEYWTEPVVRNGRTLPFAEARALFVDRTGRPGPSTWEAGDYPSGAADLPVGGVSWYEAMAYARFRGLALPTLHHWTYVARTGTMSFVVPGSNFSANAPRRGGRYGALNPFGTYDMAGNVREWVYNALGTERFILGGGWSDASYAFVDAYAQDPLDRSAINGMRLMRPVGTDSVTAQLHASIVRDRRDYAKERPVSDAVFAGIAGLYAYDRTPLDVRVESVDSSNAEWRLERVSLAPAYGTERLPLNVYVPRGGARPLQAVVFFPGSGAFYETVSPPISQGNLDAVLKSGRVVVVPVYESMYERAHTLLSDAPVETATYRDFVLHWARDVRRAVDYLVSRPDVDSTRIAYHGNSFGGRMAPIMLWAEPRFRAAVLSVAGLKMERTRPESDPLNFLPRVKLPLLMLNGRFDHYFPVETSQNPFFSFLGTPSADKKHVVFDGGHTVPRTMLISEMLGWLDRYLGPVKR